MVRDHGSSSIERSSEGSRASCGGRITCSCESRLRRLASRGLDEKQRTRCVSCGSDRVVGIGWLRAGIFNFADVAIMAGIALFLLSELFDRHKPNALERT